MLLELHKYKQNTANKEKKNQASFYQKKRRSKKQEGSGEKCKNLINTTGSQFPFKLFHFLQAQKKRTDKKHRPLT
jgi:hypothetical protein